MLRQTVRLRKEYLLKKSLESKENVIRERKRRIRQAIHAGLPIRPEDKEFELEHRRTVDLDTENSLEPSSFDDEYAHAGIKDPKILVTTSRHPSSRLMQFVKEISLLFPNSNRVNRGAYVLKDLVQLSQTHEVTDIIIVHEHRGIPDGLIVSHMPLGPTVYFGLNDVILRHDLPKKPPPMSTTCPHLIFDNLVSPLGLRITSVLKYLFPPASPLKQRVFSFVNRHDQIYFRHFVWEDTRSDARKNEEYIDERMTEGIETEKSETTSEQKVKKKKKLEKTIDGIELTEVGPRFSLRPYRIELGTVDMVDTEIEWCSRTFLNRPREVLA